MVNAQESEYQVALSFAGEQRAYVRQVASELEKRGVNTFFDERNAIALWGKDQVEEFQRIYKMASAFVVMFVSINYAGKSWPTHERRSAFAGVIQRKRDFILPVRFDDTEVPGLNTNLAYLKASDYSPEKLAEAVCEVLVSRGGRIEPPVPSFRADESPSDSEFSCRVEVHDEAGSPISGARVLFVAQNGTTATAFTQPDGVAAVPAPIRRSVAVLVAHDSFGAAYLSGHDSGMTLEVTLPNGGDRHSVIFDDQTGYIPGFRPRLNPIGVGLDVHAIPSSAYMYVTNGSVDGLAEQPFHFKVGQPLILEDNQGREVRATCVGFVGQSTLWEYRYPEDSR